MGWAYSVDLRERVVAAFDRAGMTDQEAAALFKIGEATVRRWKRLKLRPGPSSDGRAAAVTRNGSRPTSTTSCVPSWERSRTSPTRRSRGSSSGARAAP